MAHQPRAIYNREGDIQVNDPQVSQAFYDDLRGEPRDYFIDFTASGVGPASGWELYLNILVPDPANRDGRYSADVFDEQGKKIYSLDGNSFEWQEFYEPFGRDYYLKGPELDQIVPAGKYRVEVFSSDNQGKYVLAIGKKEFFDARAVLNIYWQLPLLKIQFFKTSVLEFFLTPFGIAGIGAVGGLLVLLAIIYWLVGVIKKFIEHNQAKTLFLASDLEAMKDELLKLLQKPAYDVTVAFITTASKPEENNDYMQKDLKLMEEVGFNVEQIDIEGKKEQELMKILELKDIIFVEGGNTFYLLNAMRKCNFEKVIRKLLRRGIVYIGSSAGSIVAGKTIKTAGWKDQDKNIVGLKNLKGLNLVPFDIFVHYNPEYAEIIKEKMPNPKKRFKKLKIITDDQAILVQGREVVLIGEGEAVVL